jgi:trehalose 6-phosphate synthase
VFPVGIDTRDFTAFAESPGAERQIARLRKSLQGREMIIGVDRLDYTKGLVERLLSFERLLEIHPAFRGEVSLMQIAPPSRGTVPEYANIRRSLEVATGHINGRFAESDWVPIRYLNRSFSRRALAGLLRASRIGLVTPFRDGMNLVAKEYLAAQDPENPGVLVLSRFAGAAHQLGAALIVNPYDIHAVAEALEHGLSMPLDERHDRWSAMMETLRRDDVAAWRNRFLTTLRTARVAA